LYKDCHVLYILYRSKIEVVTHINQFLRTVIRNCLLDVIIVVVFVLIIFTASAYVFTLSKNFDFTRKSAVCQVLIHCMTTETIILRVIFKQFLDQPMMLI